MMPVFPKFLKPGLFTAIAVNNPGLRPNKNHTNNNEHNLLSVDQYQCFVKWHIITHDIEKNIHFYARNLPVFLHDGYIPIL